MSENFESWVSEHAAEIARARDKRQLFLAMVAGGDSPERAAERLGLGRGIAEAIISLDILSRMCRDRI